MAFTILDSLDINSPWEMSVRVATTANITLSGTQTIDTIAVAAGELVLVKNQSTGSQNGIYVCAAGSWTRYFSGNADGDFAVGQIMYVREGSLNGKSVWSLTTVGAITVGTTALTYSRMGRAAQASAGTYGSASQVPVAVLNDDGTVSSFTATSIAIGATQVTGLTNTQVLFGNVSGQIGQSSSLIFNGTQLGVGGSPSNTIHAVGGTIRADGILYARGTGAYTSTAAPGLRLHNTAASMFWYFNNYDDGTFRITDDNGVQQLIMDAAGSTAYGASGVDYSAMLAINSTVSGFLPPRMTTTQRNAISSPATGLMLYNSTTNALTVRLASTWLELGAGGGASAGTSGSVQFSDGAGGFLANSNFKFDNTNTALVVGAATPGATIHARGTVFGNSVFLTEDDSGANLFRVEDSGNVQFGNSESYPIIYPATTGGVLDLVGTGLAYKSLLNNGSLVSHYFTHSLGTITNSAANGIVYGGSFSAGSSSTSQMTAFESDLTINQTGGASGATRAFYANDNITAAADYRQFEAGVNSGKGFWQTGGSAINLFAGNTGLGSATSPSYILDIGSSGGMRLPSGNDAARPTAATAVFRYSTTAVAPEFYDGSAWRSILHSGNGVTGSGTASQLAYWNGTNILTGDADAQFDGTNMSLGTTIVGGQRLTIVGGGNTSGSYALRIHNSGGSNNQFVVRNDGMIGILTASPIYPLHVQGSTVIGSGGAGGTTLPNTTNSPRVFNLYDDNATIRVWRKTNTTTSGPAVELVWGPVTSAQDSSGHSINRYWDFFLSGQTDRFGIRKRTGGTDVNAILVQPKMSIQQGADTIDSITGGNAWTKAASRNSVAGDRQASHFILATNANTNTSFDLFLDGSSTYPDIDNSPATSKVWGINISITVLVIAKSTGTPIVGDTTTHNYMGWIRKLAGVYTEATFTQVAANGDASLNTLAVAFDCNVSGQLVVTVTRPAGTATYAAVATVQTQEIAY